jgi:hypothetical protein
MAWRAWAVTDAVRPDGQPASVDGAAASLPPTGRIFPTSTKARGSTAREHGREIFRGLAAILLLIALVVGSLMLWTAVPAAGLWAASRLTASKAQHYLVGLPLTITAMIVWGVLLFSLNALYLRAAGFLTPHDETGEAPSLRRGPLELLLVWSLLLAFLAFLVWFFAFAKDPPPGIGL